MFRTRLLSIVLVAAGLTLAGAARAADEAEDFKLNPRGFLSTYLAPRMDSRLHGEVQAATYFTNPAENPWTRDQATVSRIERGAIRATKSALKAYAIESLGINAWSIPLIGGTRNGLGALRTDSGGARLRFGIAHMTPRAEVLIPVEAGRIAFSADAMGRVGTSFETARSGLRFSAAVSPRTHDGTFALTCSF